MNHNSACAPRPELGHARLGCISLLYYVWGRGWWQRDCSMQRYCGGGWGVKQEMLPAVAGGQPLVRGVCMKDDE